MRCGNRGSRSGKMTFRRRFLADEGSIGRSRHADFVVELSRATFSLGCLFHESVPNLDYFSRHRPIKMPRPSAEVAAISELDLASGL